jgi:hypothetical protein
VTKRSKKQDVLSEIFISILGRVVGLLLILNQINPSCALKHYFVSISRLTGNESENYELVHVAQMSGDWSADWSEDWSGDWSGDEWRRVETGVEIEWRLDWRLDWRLSEDMSIDVSGDCVGDLSGD